MAIWNLFSARQKQARGELPDVFLYDEIPHPLRIQIIHILDDAVGYDKAGHHEYEYCFSFIEKTLCHEHALFQLVPHPHNKRKDVFEYLMNIDLAPGSRIP